jgi:hypothetical protein
MEEFYLSIDVNKFRSTNAAWNDSMLNDPWSVGYVTNLIEVESFQKKEDWESFYYESGQQREFEISKLKPELQALMRDETAIQTQRRVIDNLDWNLKNLNKQHGRTREELYHKGILLHNRVKDNGFNLSIDECFKCVRYRVICETWNGVIIREKKTVENLKKHFPNIEFRKTSGEIDHTFAVDYELYKEGVLSSAIQIKPKSYTWNLPYIQRAKKSNKRKNDEYFKVFGVSVYDVISGHKGEIINKEVLNHL